MNTQSSEGLKITDEMVKEFLKFSPLPFFYDTVINAWENYKNTYTSKDNLVSKNNVAGNEKNVLFKDYLGNDVYEGDKFWFVEHNFEIGEAEPACSSSGRYSERKYFKEKIAAHQYISENKPQFSIKDFKDILKRYDYAIDMMEEVFTDLKYLGKLNDKK